MEDTQSIQLGERNYQSLYNILRAYRKAGTSRDDIAGGFNRFDTPGTYYFRIFFDFSKGLLNSLEASDISSNILWDQHRNSLAGSALNYLILNNEWERADMLRDFINLLSNISVNSPWYFSEITGLGDALDRTEFTAEGFTIGDYKTIGIKCLPDAYDNRIGTLLDLYRSMCYSWQLHKEIIPANLRRFDMYIYIFNTPIRGIHDIHGKGDGGWNGYKLKNMHKDHTPPEQKNALGETKAPLDGKYATFDVDGIKVDKSTGIVLGGPNNQYLTSAKFIHLMDCEIDLNATKSAYETVSNAEGFQMNYTIPIKVNNAIEQRYNEFLLKRIGDLVVGDMDLPGSNEDNPGDIRESYQDADFANDSLSIPNADDRLNKDRLMYGVDTPQKGVPAETHDQKVVDRSGSRHASQLHKNSNLNNEDNMFRGRESLLDPWVELGQSVLGDLGGQASQIVKSATSAIDSWTDIHRLNRAAANGVDNIVDRLVWGNLFETNIQDITRRISGRISRFSSDNIFDRTTSGWMHTTRNRGGSQQSSLGQNLGGDQVQTDESSHFNPENIQHPEEES